MRFTIIIATCDRPDRLVRTLECVCAAVQMHGEPDEIIVVDNGVTRSAKEQVDRFSSESPVSVKYRVSPPRNKAAALNTGIAAVGTEWIAFTDDDCLPEKTWLSVSAGFIEKNGYKVVGGRVIPGESDSPMPLWLKRDGNNAVPRGPALVQYEPMAESGTLDETRTVPFGSNFFVHTSIPDEYGGYDENLWAECGAAALGSEDAEFSMRIRAAGEDIGYCEECVVIHPIYGERMTLRSYLRHAYTHGLRETLLFCSDRTVRMKAYLMRRAVLMSSISIVRLMTLRPELAVRDLMKAVFAVGQLVSMRTNHPILKSSNQLHSCG